MYLNPLTPGSETLYILFCLTPNHLTGYLGGGNLGVNGFINVEMKNIIYLGIGHLAFSQGRGYWPIVAWN